MATRITEEEKNIALKVYKVSGNMTTAADAIGFNRKTLQREMKRCVQFKGSMEDAKDTYVAKLEAILDDRISNPEKDKASGILLIFKLRAEMPEKYREKVDHKVEGDIKIISAVPRTETN